ncbi:MAG: Uma2 family endonuclease [Kineosporiaceae bacterium]
MVAAAAVLTDRTRRHTVDEWLALEVPETLEFWRVELLEGRWLVSSCPGLDHQWGGDQLQTVLMSAVEAAGREDLVAVTGMGVVLNPYNGLRPDIMICPRRLAGRVVSRQELGLAVEIWSPSNRRAERQRKRAVNAAAGVPFWWEIRQDRGGPSRLETFRLVDGAYVGDQVVEAGHGAVPVAAAPVPVTVDLSALRL